MEDPSTTFYDSVSISRVKIPANSDPDSAGVWGVAVWQDLDPRLDFITIYVTGLSNAFQVFELPDGSVKAVLPSRVPEHETAYAMTIHKSQGSEFDHTLMILPAEFTPLLTRELIYTGITRAKHKLTMFFDERLL